MKFLTLAILVGAICNLAAAKKFDPYWWNEVHADGKSPGYGFLNPTNLPPDDSLISAGRFKDAVVRTISYLKNDLPGGAGPKVTALTRSRWFKSRANQRAQVSTKQFRAVIAVIYDRIAEEFSTDIVNDTTAYGEGQDCAKSPSYTQGWLSCRWDTSWIMHDGYRELDRSKYPDAHPWAKAGDQWKVVSDDFGYPWLKAKGLVKDSDPVTLGQLKTALSFEFPLQSTLSSPNGVTLRKILYPFGAKPETATQQIDYLYSPNLKRGETAPLIIVLPGGPSKHTYGPNVNQGAFLQWCRNGKTRAHCLVVGSSSEGIVTTIPELLEQVMANRVPGINTAVDRNRIYLFGYSYGTLTASRLLDLNPDQYAAVMLSGIANWPQGKWRPTNSDEEKKAFAAKVGHVPMLLSRGSQESISGILKVPDYEEWATLLRAHNPKTFLLQSPGAHTGSMCSTTNHFHNFKWLFSHQKK